MNNKLTVSAAIRSYLSAHRDEITADLIRLAQIPSVKGTPLPDAPYGRDCKNVLETALSMFRETGAKTRQTPFYGTADWDGTAGGEAKHYIGLFAHLDVVPAGDGWQKTEAFSPREQDGILYGRGVSDNKSGALAALYALRTVQALRLPLTNRVRVFLGIDEESGMSDITHYTDAEPCLPDVSIVPDGSFPVSAGEKGICRFYVHTPPLHDVRGVQGGEALNVVLSRATVTLAYSDALLRELESLVVGRDRCSLSCTDGEIILTTEGVSRHASMPEGSENAFLSAAKLLSACQNLHPSDREIFIRVTELLRDDYGTALGLAGEDECFGRVTATNGIIRQNGEGGIAFSFDVRYGKVFDAAAVADRLKQAGARLGQQWRIEMLENEAGFSIPTDSPYLTALCDVYAAASHASSRVSPFYMAGGTYARHLPNAFSVGTSAPYVLGSEHLPDDDNRVHCSDEYIVIDQFLEGIAVITEMLLACDGNLTAADRSR